MLAAHAPVVISACETAEERSEAVLRLLDMAGESPRTMPAIDLDGAERAADEILALAGHRAAA
jgi:hypothetical protein